MAQKRVLLIGTILVSAAIGVPTMAMLAPGGGVSEAPSPAVEPADPDPVPPEPVDEQALPFPAVTPATTAAQAQRPPADSGGEVPSHLGTTAAPPRLTAPPRKPAIVPAEENEPQPPGPEPIEEETVVPPPTLPSDPDDADTGDHPSPPGGPVQDDQDPADGGDDPADR
jgi:hypothetical protein